MDLPTYLATSNMTQRALADLLEVTPAMIWQWLNGYRPISEQRCLDIEHATGGLVTCEELRPDVDLAYWAYLRRRKTAVTCEELRPDVDWAYLRKRTRPALIGRDKQGGRE